LIEALALTRRNRLQRCTFYGYRPLRHGPRGHPPKRGNVDPTALKGAEQAIRGEPQSSPLQRCPSSALELSANAYTSLWSVLPNPLQAGTRFSAYSQVTLLTSMHYCGGMGAGRALYSTIKTSINQSNAKDNLRSRLKSICAQRASGINNFLDSGACHRPVVFETSVW